MCSLKLTHSPTAVKNREWWRVEKLFLAPKILVARGLWAPRLHLLYLLCPTFAARHSRPRFGAGFGAWARRPARGAGQASWQHSLAWGAKTDLAGKKLDHIAIWVHPDRGDSCRGGLEWSLDPRFKYYYQLISWGNGRAARRGNRKRAEAED